MKLSMKGKKLQTLNDPKTWNSRVCLLSKESERGSGIGCDQCGS